MGYFDKENEDISRIMEQIDSILNHTDTKPSYDDILFPYYGDETCGACLDIDKVASSFANTKKKGPAASEDTKPVTKAEARHIWKKHAAGIQAVGSPQKVGLTESEFTRLFSYFLPIAGMPEQILSMLAGYYNSLSSAGQKMAGHVIIQSERKNGGDLLGVSLCRAMRVIAGDEEIKAAKIKGSALNRHDPSEAATLIGSGYLVITEAGDMNAETKEQLSWILNHNIAGMNIILVDNSEGIDRVFEGNEALSKMFTQQVKVPFCTSDELVYFARAYARQNGYVLSKAARNTLHKKIQAGKKGSITMSDISAITDKAMRKADKKAADRQPWADGRVVVTEEDMRRVRL